MSILESLIDGARNSLISGKENLRIDNIILGKSLYTIKGSESVFTDMNFCLILLENAYGFSYFQEEIDYGLSKFVNKEILAILDEEMPTYFRIALADALYCYLNREVLATSTVLFVGNLREKARQRARKLLSSIPFGARVLLIGAATEIIDEAVARNIDLSVLDLEPQKIGLQISGKNVESGGVSDFTERMKSVEYVIATGMIFVSDTADEISRLATENKIKLIMYMETGSNFGPQLLSFGATKVLAEYFPFYDFFGNTKYSIFESSMSKEKPNLQNLLPLQDSTRL